MFSTQLLIIGISGHGHDIEDDQQPIKKTHTWTDYLEYAITFFWRLVWAIFLPPESK